MGIYVKGVDMPKQDEILQIRIYGNGKVSRVYDIKCQQIGTAIETPNELVRCGDCRRGRYNDDIEYYSENKWIPCSERLPSEGGYYLCCNKGCLPFVAHYYDGQWHDFDWTTPHIDAWRPLPESYREDDEE